MNQILRIWTFWILASFEAECRNDVDQMVLTPMRLAPGNHRATALFNPGGDGTVEVIVLSVWDSLEHIKAYAGPGYLQPMIPPTHLDKVFAMEPAVHHYAMNEIPPSLRDWTLPYIKPTR